MTTLKKYAIGLLGAAFVVASAFAAGEIFGPANPNLVGSYTVTSSSTVNFTPKLIGPATKPAATDSVAAQLAYNVPYATFSVTQVTTNNPSTSNVVYTVSGSIAGTNWNTIAALTVPLTGTNTVGGYTNIPQSQLGGFKYFALTSVAPGGSTNVTFTARLGYWHLQ